MRNVRSTCESMAQHTSRVSSHARKMLPNVGQYGGSVLSICLTKPENITQLQPIEAA